MEHVPRGRDALGLELINTQHTQHRTCIRAQIMAIADIDPVAI